MRCNFISFCINLLFLIWFWFDTIINYRLWVSFVIDFFLKLVFITNWSLWDSIIRLASTFIRWIWLVFWYNILTFAYIIVKFTSFNWKILITNLNGSFIFTLIILNNNLLCFLNFIRFLWFNFLKVFNQLFLKFYIFFNILLIVLLYSGYIWCFWNRFVFTIFIIYC